MVGHGQKITYGEMREAGYTRIIVSCSDYKCSHSTVISAEQWGDDIRLSDIEPQFVCSMCGMKGAEVRPDRMAE